MRARRLITIALATLACPLSAGASLTRAVTASSGVSGPVAFEASLELELGGFPAAVTTAAGVATLTGSGPHGFNALHLPEVLQLPTATFSYPVTPTSVTPNPFFGGFTVVATLPEGSFAPLTGGQPLTRVFPLRGSFRICLFIPVNCGSFATGFSLSSTYFGIGLGLGGSTFGGAFFGGAVAQFAPWTVGPVTLTDFTGTASLTVMRTGFVHAANSSTTGAIPVNGALQLVAPTQINTVIMGEPGPRRALFSKLTLQFLPEPSAILTLACGAGLLALLGWRRQ